MSSIHHPDNDVQINPAANESILDVVARSTQRRTFLQGSLAAAAVTALGGLALPGDAQAHGDGKGWGKPGPRSPKIGFQSVAANTAAAGYVDAVTVPPGYSARVLIGWGDAIGKPGPNAHTHWNASTAFTPEVGAFTYGSHTDGMHYFPMTRGGRFGRGADRGLLVANHEYVDPGLLLNTTTYATDTITPEKVEAQLAAHGVTVVEVKSHNGEARVQRPSVFARRIDARTPMRISGPAAGHAKMRTAADPTGRHVLGTMNNCAHGYTPWGTYLTCEENFNGYFGATADKLAAQPLTTLERRYGFNANGFGYRWFLGDARFDIRANPNEPNRFGWVVEIDPFDPTSTPVKRTALGRFKHESAQYVLGRDNRIAFYMGDDERNEYIYKFVAKKRFRPHDPRANRDLLDEGTLYVAKFNADGSGQWLPLVWGQGALTPANGFADQGDVVINARAAADRAGATMMDRPEWIAVHPKTGDLFVTLTNNNRRGTNPPSSNAAEGTTTAGSARPPVDAANPRANNIYGHIIRWSETGGDVAATTFEWEVFVECGDKASADANLRGSIDGDDLGAPDGIWCDDDGRLWVQTDQQGDGTGDWANIGGNVMSCVDPATKKVKRFLTSPRNCEVTGVVTTPDGRTMFVGIQHPGEDWNTGAGSSYVANSTWPDSGVNGATTQAAVIKPRSAVVVVTKDDGGVIGT
jgi:hypothetical protein